MGGSRLRLSSNRCILQSSKLVWFQTEPPRARRPLTRLRCLTHDSPSQAHDGRRLASRRTRRPQYRHGVPSGRQTKPSPKWRRRSARTRCHLDLPAQGRYANARCGQVLASSERSMATVAAAAAAAITSTMDALGAGASANASLREFGFISVHASETRVRSAPRGRRYAHLGRCQQSHRFARSNHQFRSPAP